MKLQTSIKHVITLTIKALRSLRKKQQVVSLHILIRACWEINN